ncbi:MAG: UDP-N-acetylmuramoyl-L-alanine--D-glutamate ligase [Elusimicrobia bacterium]|nr:UDP-N-acetylmuramoyl-L-alanine--D-glutamate ligase [Elusimicrobiota bacterium]
MDRFDPKLLRKKHAGILGLGRSGLQAANLLARKGFKVLVSDRRPRRETALLARKLRPGVRWEGGGHSDKLLRCAFAVKSPGIASHAPILEKLRKAGVPVFSELETALAFCPARGVVAVTGTNGKTTTTLLLASIFKAARRGHHAAGNLGIALSAVSPKVKKKDTLILEVSSYQLEDSRYFRPSVGALLNVTADHIDHHGGMSRYIQAKARLFHRQDREDYCVFNGDDPIVVKLSRQCPARKLFFSHHRRTLSHAWIDSGKICVKLPRQAKETRLSPPKLPGLHNLENAMAAALAALASGIKTASIQKGFKGFKGVEHRLEPCAAVRAIHCINDSKATNVESTLTALKALSDFRAPRILLILGGLHKGYPYTPLRSFLGTTVKGILTIGSAARKVEEDLSGCVPIFPCSTLKDAVKIGLQVGAKGDILLLSPACASFDQFQDFEDRGRQFKDFLRKARAGKL